MTTPNSSLPIYKPADEVTGHVTSAVLGKHFVKISGNRSADGNISIAPPSAAGRTFGVAAFDGGIGDKVTVHHSPGMIVPVVAAGNITAFAEVEVDATGAVVTLAAGVARGYVVTGATNGGDAQVCLY
jgi:hypothetical protein